MMTVTYSAIIPMPTVLGMVMSELFAWIQTEMGLSVPM